MSAAEVVVAGHVSLDLYPELYGPVKLEPGHLVQIGPASFSTGGAVTNAGLALHRLGVAVRLIGRVGPDLFGSAVRDALAAHGAGLADGIVSAAGEVTSYTIVINPPGIDRSFLHCPGANATFSAEDVPDAELTGGRIFHFGYPPLMPRMYADDGAGLERLFARAHGAGLVTSLDMCSPDPDSEAGRVDWEQILARVLPHVDVFAPSIEELLFMLDRDTHRRLADADALTPVIDGALLDGLAGQLLALGSAIVAIKLGDQGLYVHASADPDRLAPLARALPIAPGAWADCALLSPCFRARTIAGTTGSGDATIAGLLAALLHGADPARAATIATAVGACSVEGPDPTSAIPVWEELQARIDAGWEREPVALDLRAGPADVTGTLVLGR